MDGKISKSYLGRMVRYICILAFALALMIVPVTAFAEDGAEGDAGTIYWAVNGDKELTISDTEITGEGLTTGSFPADRENPLGIWDNNIVSVEVQGSPKPIATSHWFDWCFNLASADLTGLDTSECTNMSDMFYYCRNLEEVITGPEFDTSKCKDMSYMFAWCDKLSFDAVENMGLDTSACEKMCAMFCGCKAFTHVDLSNFDTSNCKLFSYMFEHCNNLEELDLSVIDMSACESAEQMVTMTDTFALNKIVLGETYKAGDIEFPYYHYSSEKGVWVNGKTKKVFTGSALIPKGAGTYEYTHEGLPKYDAYWALSGDRSTGYDLIISPDELTGDYVASDQYNTAADFWPWQTAGYSRDDIVSITFKKGAKGAKVKYPELNLYFFMDNGEDEDYYSYGLFERYYGLKTIDLRGLDATDCTNADYFLSQCYNLESINLEGFDTSTLRSARDMFSSCNKLTELDLSKLVFNSVNASSMFGGCTNLKSVKFNKKKKPVFTEVNSLFSYCKSIETIDLSGVIIKDPHHMGSMFSECNSLKTLKLGDPDTSNCIYMSSMFSGCELLESIDISVLETAKCEDMSNMFAGCKSLETIDLNALDTSSCKYMTCMFQDCTGLKTVDLGSMELSSCQGLSRMFYGCTALENVEVSSADTSKCIYMDGVFWGCSSLEDLDLSDLELDSAQYMDSMFKNCTALKRLDVSGFDMSSIHSLRDMFAGCTALEQLTVGPAWKNDFKWERYKAKFPVTMYRADDGTYTEYASDSFVPSYSKSEANCNIYVNAAKKDDEAFKADLEAAIAVAEQINALGDMTSLDQAADVEAAQSAYDALTDEQKALFPDSGLVELEAAYDGLGQLDPIKAGDTLEDGYLIYTVTNAEEKTVSVKLTAAGKKKAVNVEIPDVVRIKYTNCDITTIPSKGFAKAKRLRTVTGGAAIKEILGSAFYKDKKLNKCEITSKSLSKIGKSAFKKCKKLKTLRIPITKELTKAGVYKSLKGSKIKTVRVNQGKKAAYKKIFTKKNCGRKVSVR